MKTGLIAVVIMLSVTLAVAGLAPGRQLGTSVCNAEAATIVGGDCHNEFSNTCFTVGSCASTSVVGFSGNGDRKQKDKTYCGSGGLCSSFSKNGQWCGG